MGVKHLITACCVLIIAGCTTIDPRPRVDEAMRLVERSVGQRPNWETPWEPAAAGLDDGTVLSLDRAITLSLQNNRALRAEIERIGSANADLVQAGLLQNPVFNFMIMLPDGGGRAMLRSSALPMQQLQDLWLIPARQETANAELQEAVLRVADQGISTVGNIKVTYARLQYAQRATELVQANMEVVARASEALRAKLTANQATQAEANLFRIRYLRLRSDLLAAQAKVRSIQRQLMEQMGTAFSSDRWRVESIREIADRLEPPRNEDELVQTALAERLDLKAAEWSAQAAERRIALREREGWPDLALGLTLERPPAARSGGVSVPARAANAAAQAVTNSAFGVTQPMPPTMTPFRAQQRQVNNMVGPMIEMEIPIFDQNRAQVAKAKHQYQQSAAEYEARVQEAARMVRETCVRHEQSYAQVQLFREALIPESERNVELARQSFVAGKEDLAIYLQAQEDLILMRMKALDYYRDYLVSRAELERFVGGRLPDEPRSSADQADGSVPSGNDAEEHDHAGR